MALTLIFVLLKYAMNDTDVITASIVTFSLGYYQDSMPNERHT